jgi:hypothetical protein
MGATKNTGDVDIIAAVNREQEIKDQIKSFRDEIRKIRTSIGKTKNRLTEQQIARCVDLYSQGSSTREIARIYGISHQGVRNYLLSRGVLLRSNGNTGREEESRRTGKSQLAQLIVYGEQDLLDKFCIEAYKRGVTASQFLIRAGLKEMEG